MGRFEQRHSLSLAQAYRASHYPETIRPIEKESSSLLVDPLRLGAIFDMHALELDCANLPVSERSDQFTDRCDVRRKGITATLDSAAQLRAAIIEQLSSTKAIDFISNAVGERRYPDSCQVYRTHVGGDLAAHSHGKNDVFVIFHFSRSYEGGRYFEIIKGKRDYPVIEPYSAVINRNSVMHGVDLVSSGTRMVLVSAWEPSQYKR